MRDAEQVPANLQPYVDALGAEEAERFFLALGGSDIYLPIKSSPRSLAARTIGADRVEKLADAMGAGYYKVPLARQWIARSMAARGAHYAEIARTVRADVATVRRWLGPRETHQQPQLF
ncbi:hypothetical protein AWH62_00870 [Maricaulis sp. W15]|uniref:helix-turn-helix domain containing protein n=1 Tax=Maricaulis sp. W15 TaxID=1772333 RepID=UPI0009491329|nr:helix-turn-helix domain containing protein [Maricaulis sp. W15]OLF81259.1 hypothetical protein AWH62_00870 [Maricaulis sp. W15]